MASAGRGSGSALLDLLVRRIRDEGPLRFDAFQEIALYADGLGYYEKPGRVGREGDFVTGASWHPAFARAIARVARRVRDELGEPIEVLDVGAGEGQLLGWLAEALSGDDAIAVAGVERSPRRRAIAASRASVPLHASLEEAPRLRGVAVAYELFDALPVRSLRFAEDGRVRERCVTLENGALVFVERPSADGELILDLLARRGATVVPGQVIEVRPAAAAMARALAEKLEAGVLLVFDYGARARALYGPARQNGTLEAFSRHLVTRDVLAEPGERDITAWVDFTELEEELSAAGLSVRGLVSQSRLLLAAGIAGELADDDPERPPDAVRSAERNAIAKLFAPGGMGEAIRVLVAERATSVGASLVRFPV
jgi:SAM-dependent MidA family methyltransferase